jgi:hypothetical protein
MVKVAPFRIETLSTKYQDNTEQEKNRITEIGGRKMKKLLLIVLALILVLALATGCGNSNDGGTGAEPAPGATVDEGSDEESFKGSGSAVDDLGVSYDLDAMSIDELTEEGSFKAGAADLDTSDWTAASEN